MTPIEQMKYLIIEEIKGSNNVETLDFIYKLLALGQ